MKRIALITRVNGHIGSAARREQRAHRVVVLAMHVASASEIVTNLRDGRFHQDRWQITTSVCRRPAASTRSLLRCPQMTGSTISTSTASAPVIPARDVVFASPLSPADRIVLFRRNLPAYNP